jgi:hypothetical protein
MTYEVQIIGYCTIALAMIKEKKDKNIDYP